MKHRNESEWKETKYFTAPTQCMCNKHRHRALHKESPRCEDEVGRRGGARAVLCHTLIFCLTAGLGLLVRREVCPRRAATNPAARRHKLQHRELSHTEPLGHFGKSRESRRDGGG